MVGEASTVADAFTVFSSGLLENGLGKGKAIPDEYHSARIEAKVGRTKSDSIQGSPQ